MLQYFFIQNRCSVWHFSIFPVLRSERTFLKIFSETSSKSPPAVLQVVKGEMRMENRKRNVQIIVRVTEEERALIEKKMKQIPTINLSAYSRKMLIDGYIIVLDLQEVKAHTAQLQKIGVNVNQIARRIMSCCLKIRPVLHVLSKILKSCLMSWLMK